MCSVNVFTCRYKGLPIQRQPPNLWTFSKNVWTAWCLRWEDSSRDLLRSRMIKSGLSWFHKKAERRYVHLYASKRQKPNSFWRVAYQKTQRVSLKLRFCVCPFTAKENNCPLIEKNCPLSTRQIRFKRITLAGERHPSSISCGQLVVECWAMWETQRLI